MLCLPHALRIKHYSSGNFIIITRRTVPVKAGFSERNILVMGVTFALGLGLAADQAAVAHLPACFSFIFHLESDRITHPVPPAET